MDVSTPYEYKIHEYKGYAMIKYNYGGTWHIHEIKGNEINMFRELGFARTIGEAKKLIDKETSRGKKK